MKGAASGEMHLRAREGRAAASPRGGVRGEGRAEGDDTIKQIAQMPLYEQELEGAPAGSKKGGKEGLRVGKEKG